MTALAEAPATDRLREQPPPRRMAGLPRQRGWVVPWFVAETEPGVFDFRVLDGRKVVRAVREHRCWLCGGELGRYLAYVAGPMCGINRVSSEPPSHRECAEFAARACPFLTQHEIKRREGGLPDTVTEPAGIGIRRQPGTTILWITRSYRVVRVAGDPAHGVEAGVLFRMGDPTDVLWFRDGRAATRAEVDESLRTGYPLLLAEAEQEGPEALAALAAQREAMAPLLPARSIATPAGEG